MRGEMSRFLRVPEYISLCLSFSTSLLLAMISLSSVTVEDGDMEMESFSSD